MVKLTNLRLRGNNLTTQYLRLGYTAPTPAPAPGPGPSPEPEPEPLIPGLEGIVGIWNAYGLTNEEMKANPVWKDLSGNGNDIELKNFAWALDDGVGKYLHNFASGNWFAYNSLVDAKLESTRITLKSGGGDPAPLQFTSVIRRKDFGLQGVKFTGKVIITGLDSANGEPFYFGKFDEQANTSVLLHEGLNDIDFTIPSFWTWYGFGFRKIINNVNITIQLLPYAYENALVFDGVDDYGESFDFPQFTKEKGYTVMALRKQPENYYGPICSKPSTMNGWTGVFSFEKWSSKSEYPMKEVTTTFGNRNEIIFEKSVITYQTSKDYNGITLTTGQTNDTNSLLVGAELYRFSTLALYSLVILDHDSTPEERALIKNYWMKYYADMIEYDKFDPSKPTYAWTVKGKTNGDLDRATVKELRGSGNDLGLTNFGFTAQSGYTDDGYLQFDGVDDQCRSIENIKLDGYFTVICEIDLKDSNPITFVISMRDGLDIDLLYALTDKTTNIVVFKKGDIKLNGFQSLNAIVSNGVVYDKQWSAISGTFGNKKPIDTVIDIGCESDYIWAKMKFKNFAFYPGNLTKPQCQKAYDWLQEQVAPKADYGGIAIEGAPNGVYILATDNKLYTSAKWKAEWNWAAVGVAVVSDESKFVISPESETYTVWGGRGILINDIITTTDSTVAITDYSGSDNTDKIIAQLGTGKAPAAEYCRGIIFKNGKKGYLPACGEWQIANSNKTEVDNCMSLISGVVFNKINDYITSTQRDDVSIWIYRWYNASKSYTDKSGYYYVRSFAPLT